MNRSAMLAAVVIGSAPLAAHAQQWTLDPSGTSATLPPSIAGAAIRIAAMSCIDGLLAIEVGVGPAIDPPGPGGSSASISIDGAAFPTKAEQLAHSTAVIVPLAAVPALKGGSRMTVTYPGYAGTVRSTFPLKGSRTVLTAMEGKCALPTAAPVATGSNGGTTAQGGSSDAVKRLQAALADELLAECRAYGGKSVTFETGAVTTTGNPAAPEVVFDFHHIICNGASFSTVATGVGYCGAGPCLQRHFTYTGGRYVEGPSYYR